MTKPPLFLTVMIADANRLSARTLQRVLEGKPNVAKAEVFDQSEAARRSVCGAGFNCLFVDIFSLGVDAGIDLIQHVETTCPQAAICLYSDSSSLITMPDVSAAWRKRFGHYPKLGKDQLTLGSELEVDTLLGSLASQTFKAQSREKTGKSTGLVEPPPMPRPASQTGVVKAPPLPKPPIQTGLVEPPPTPEPANRGAAQETTTPLEPGVSDRVRPLAGGTRLPVQPMLSRIEYGIEVVTPPPRAKTGRAFDISGAYSSLPAGHHIWVVAIEQSSLQNPEMPATNVRPYRPLAEASARTIGKWYAHVDYVGGKVGDFKTLAVCVAGPNGQILFDYFKAAGGEARKLLAKKKTTKSLIEGIYDRLPPLLEYPTDVVECVSHVITIWH